MNVAAEVWLALGTSTIYEASKLPCALDPRLRPAWSGAEACAPAYPVGCLPGDNLALHTAVELAPAGSILVVDGGGLLVGYWGEVLTRAAQRQGIAGLVIDGGVRDIDSLEMLGFPVFARGVSMLGTYKAGVGTLGGPTDVGGVVVAAGDLVVADRDGVICLPRADVGRVLVEAKARQVKEAAMIEAIRAGAHTLDLYGWRQLLTETEQESTDLVSGETSDQGAP
ncbi:MAG: 4-hydroxy-4-methyl-2-oxoglutarate aldolase [Actinomycetota bacterium]|nr:4-hydroxy-4-methyl-2-oxoglutarate aldolase [Actinomycetota bacterium]